ncbi:peptidoglycan-binding protein [Allobranchiibius sp. GilTou73]|uniref:peptidoglycan-binding domain-containing protein n=1 Tax=Allobranchiibius sp. GilTou73 TaxID=2904523 RepID=UPI001F40979C|nr:peptidoglycan-binding protein [Allobranchiibius sp. GilTou73]UIJ36382.1 peptidoglycan-binding protein [Allobranchiibius sp. GilTou73]
MTTSRRALLGATAATALAVAGALQAEAATAATAPNRPYPVWSAIGPGSSFHDVRALQYLLYARGFRVTAWESSYGPATRAAVVAFQHSVGIDATGLASSGTVQSLCDRTVRYGVSDIRVYAVQTLLDKHGYGMTLRTPYYGTQTDRNVRGFQIGHGMDRAAYVDTTCWRSLLGPVTSGPLMAMMQRDTGAAQWANCGPVAMVSLLLHLGRTPHGWDGITADRATAVQYMRYTTMHVPDTTARNARGTEFPDLAPAFVAYGLSAWHGGIDDTLAYARAGRPSICGGDAYRMPYKKSASRPTSHWVTVLGWTGTYYLVADPLSDPSTDYVHALTESQLRYYAAANPGHPASTASRNCVLPR